RTHRRVHRHSHRSNTISGRSSHADAIHIAVLRISSACRNAGRLNLVTTNRLESTGMNPPTSATGTGWERTPWHATQRAACEALKKEELLLGALLRGTFFRRTIALLQGVGLGHELAL